jgi:hypothetical protein
MGYDVLKRKCGAHNRIIGNRETCPQCASDLRAKMGPKPQKLTYIRDEASFFDQHVYVDPVLPAEVYSAYKKEYEDKLAIDEAGKLSWSKPATMDWQLEGFRVVEDRYMSNKAYLLPDGLHVSPLHEGLDELRMVADIAPLGRDMADQMLKILYSRGIDPAFK